MVIWCLKIIPEVRLSESPNSPAIDRCKAMQGLEEVSPEVAGAAEV